MSSNLPRRSRIQASTVRRGSFLSLYGSVIAWTCQSLGRSSSLSHRERVGVRGWLSPQQFFEEHLLYWLGLRYPRTEEAEFHTSRDLESAAHHWLSSRTIRVDHRLAQLLDSPPRRKSRSRIR